MINNKVAVLVNSCDSYSDIWQYFFYFVDTYWKDCPYKFYLNTETSFYDYTAPCGEKLENINSKIGLPWSKRLINALNSIREEYVIHILDDSFILENVNQNTIEKCLSNMENDKNIGCFHFEEHIPNPYNTKENGYGFRQMDSRESFLSTAHATLWRKTFLKKILRKDENPWQFELYGTERIRHYREKVYALSADSPSVIHYYVKGRGGYGISGGKWAPNTVNLFKKHNLTCDFSKRGFYDIDKMTAVDLMGTNPKLSFFDKLFLPVSDKKLFKEKMEPRVLKLESKIDILGRLKNLFN